MGTEVLRPQDCLSLQRANRNNCRYGNSYSTPKPTNHLRRNPRDQARQEARPDRQRSRFVRARSEPAIPTHASLDDAGTGRGNMVMEKVTILRRGESLDSTTTMMRSMAGGDGQSRGVAFGGLVGDVYAGMAFAVSPEPSSLPVPSFSRRRNDGAVDDSATRDLRRLLRLD